MAAPLIESADCTNSSSDTAQSSWVVSTPAASTGDLLIFCIGWDDNGAAVSSVTAPTGPNGETLTSVLGPQAAASTEVRGQVWQTIATGSWSAGTRTFTPAASESWRATVIRVPAGEFDSTTPIGAANGRASPNTTSSTVRILDQTLGSTDGGSRLVAFGVVDQDPVTATPSGWTTVSNADIGTISTFVSTRDTETSNSESIDGATFSWTIAADGWATISFVVRAPSNTRNTTIGATEAGVDTASLQAKVTLATNIAATEAATKDTASLQTKVLLQTSVGATEAQVKDTASLQASIASIRDLSISATEGQIKDTGSWQTQVLLAARVTATETGADTASLQTKALVGTRVAATEAATKDTASLQTRVILTSRITATEAQVKDTGSWQTKVLLAARVASTETGADTASLQTAVRLVTTLSATETTVDTVLLNATLGTAARNATIGTTEAQVKDTASLQTKALLATRVTATESGADTAALQSTVVWPARNSQLLATELGADTGAFQVTVSAFLRNMTLGAVEGVPDTAVLRLAGQAPVVSSGKFSRFIQPFAA